VTSSAPEFTVGGTVLWTGAGGAMTMLLLAHRRPMTHGLGGLSCACTKEQGGSDQNW
jgi:hypothetical protein